MRQEIINICKFDDLDEKAKEKAIAKFQADYEYQECDYDFIICEFLEDIEKKYGINVDYEDVHFSGFWSQGDGASFTCDNISSVQIEKLLPIFDIKIKHGLHDLFCNSYVFSIDRRSFHYYHKNTVYVNYEISGTPDFAYMPHIEKYMEDTAEKFADCLEDLKNSLCVDLYEKLEKNYDYMTSKECIEEEIRENEIEFLEDGTQY